MHLKHLESEWSWMNKLLDNFTKCSRLYHTLNSHPPYWSIFIYRLTFVLAFLISTYANVGVGVGSLNINRPNSSIVTLEGTQTPAQSEVLLFQ